MLAIGLRIKMFSRITLKAQNWELTLSVGNEGKLLSHYVMVIIAFLFNRRIGILKLLLCNETAPKVPNWMCRSSMQNGKHLIFKNSTHGVWNLLKRRPKNWKSKGQLMICTVFAPASHILHSQTVVWKQSFIVFLASRLHLCPCRWGDDSNWFQEILGNKPPLCWVRKLWLLSEWHQQASHPPHWISQLIETHC